MDFYFMARFLVLEAGFDVKLHEVDKTISIAVELGFNEILTEPWW